MVCFSGAFLGMKDRIYDVVGGATVLCKEQVVTLRSLVAL